METCRFCGARLFAGSDHCARCLAPIAASAEEIAKGLLEIHAAAGRWHNPTPKGEPWAPDTRYSAPEPRKLHSRWRAGVLSFSLPTKIALSFAIAVGVPILFWIAASALALGPIIIWSITITPRALRDLWKRSRIR